MEAPIPTPRLDDDEDVHWALSTAGALWGRGERTEALKWLRRAAEQASDVNADVRALELYKAAADVANKVSTPAPPPAAPQAPAAAAPPPPPPVRKPVLPTAPPRPGSAYPPPVAPQAAPAPPFRPAPPPARPGPPVAAASPARPPPVVVPSRAVAITAAKAPTAPQAMTPKRRRSFTGETRPSAEKARSPEPAPRSARREQDGKAATPAQQPARAVDGTHKRRQRTFTDDDATGPQKPRDGGDNAGDPTTIMVLPSREQVRAAVQNASIFDDLDEDTRVLSARSAANRDIDAAREKLRSEPGVEPSPPVRNEISPPPPEPARPPPAQEEPTTDGTLASDLLGVVTSLNARRWAPEPSPEAGLEASLETHAEASPRSELGPVTERPPPPSTRAGPQAKRLDTLPALRVAVLGTGALGEVRLISLGADEPPPGAAVAVLVPLTASDGDAIARLFGADE